MLRIIIYSRQQITHQSHECRSQSSADPVNLSPDIVHNVCILIPVSFWQSPHADCREKEGYPSCQVPSRSPAYSVNQNTTYNQSKGESKGLAETNARKGQIPTSTLRQDLRDD